jgi:hypothetical protein
MHTAKPLITEPCSPEFETANEKLKRFKSAGTDRILAEEI